MEYFEENGHQCHMLDIFDYVNHRLGNSIQDGYLLSTKYLAKTYAKAYGKLTQKDEPYDRNSLVSIFSRFVSKKLEKFVVEYNPDFEAGRKCRFINVSLCTEIVIRQPLPKLKLSGQ